MKKRDIERVLTERGQANIEINMLQSKIEMLKLDIQGISGGMSYEDTGGGGTNVVSSRVENEVIKRDEKINNHAREITRLEHFKSMVDGAISLLDEVEQIIIKAKYYDRLPTWYDVAEKTGYTYTWCMKVKNKAFNKLSKIL